MRIVALCALTATLLSATDIDTKLELLEKRLQAQEERLKTSNEESRYTLGGKLQFDATLNSPAIDNATHDYYMTPKSFSDDPKIAKFSTNARNTRIWFKSTSKTELGLLRSLVEMDFYGTSGTETVTNSHNMRLRHAYITLNNWTIGQTSSTFMGNSLPDTIFFSSDVVFVRQPLLKYTANFDALNVDFALENPQTNLYHLDTNTTRSSNDDSMPDYVLRMRFDTTKMRASLSVLGRSIDYQDGDQRYSKQAWASNATIHYVLPNNDAIQAAYIYGNGVGRYVALGSLATGTYQNGTIELRTIQGGHFSYTHRWTNKLRSTILYSSIESKESETQTSSFINLRYAPMPQTLITLEASQGDRDLITKTQSLERLMASVSYIF